VFFKTAENRRKRVHATYSLRIPLLLSFSAVKRKSRTVNKALNGASQQQFNSSNAAKDIKTFK